MRGTFLKSSSEIFEAQHFSGPCEVCVKEKENVTETMTDSLCHLVKAAL